MTCLRGTWYEGGQEDLVLCIKEPKQVSIPLTQDDTSRNLSEVCASCTDTDASFFVELPIYYIKNRNSVSVQHKMCLVKQSWWKPEQVVSQLVRVSSHTQGCGFNLRSVHKTRSNQRMHKQALFLSPSLPFLSLPKIKNF